MTADQYMKWLSGKVQIGGYITASPSPNGIYIKFHYFGDK